VWIKEKVIVIFKLRWTIIVWKTGYFSYVQPQYLTFINAVIMMYFNFFQGSAATVCRCSCQMNNCCVATYLGILCAKYYKNQSMFIKTTPK